MARNHDDHGVLAVGGADRAHRLRPAQLLSELAIRGGFSEGDVAKGTPHGALKWGPFWSKRDAEPNELAS
jgi:hypothetical protein